jgi:hypothetical protein
VGLVGKFRRLPSRLIPQRKLHAVPQAKLVVDHAQIILYHMFRGTNGIGHVAVLQALGDKLDDSVLALVGSAGSITFVCKHDCLL